MPYVQRDYDGKIKGVYANKQPGYAEEFLSDDNAEVVAYLQKHPPADLTPLTHEQVRKLNAEHKKLEKEHEALRTAMLAVLQSWTELEVALSALLYVILKIKGHISYAIYYAPVGLEARIEIVKRALEQFIIENPEIEELGSSWKTICQRTKRAREIRNGVAHGSPCTLYIRGKAHARLAAPPFDIIRVSREMSQGQIPRKSRSANDLVQNVQKVRRLTELVDDVNRVLDAYHANSHTTWQERLHTLKSRLNHPERP